MAQVEINGVRKQFGTVRVLSDVHLRIREGEFLTLLGPSGCGKSTLLRIIAGLETQDAGSIAIGDAIVDHQPPKRRDVAMVFQSYALYPYMTVAQNIGLPLTMRRLSAWQRLPLVGSVLPGSRSIRAGIANDVRGVAEALDIGHLLERKPAQLSGGQRQRVALGRAMVRHPRVFLMDEPLSNLDAKLRVQMRAEIADLHRRLGTTFIYVTHDQAEAMTMSDRVAVMMDGHLLQVAPPRQVYADPEDRRIAEFIGSPRINCLDASARSDGAVDIGGTVLAIEAGLPAGTKLVVGIRPEAFVIHDEAQPNALAGRIRLVEHLGPDLYLHIDMVGHPAPVVVRAAPHRADRLHPDRVVHFMPEADRVLLFATDGRRIRPAATMPMRQSA